MKILDGKELAGFIKERQAGLVRAMLEERGGRAPRLLILRDSEDPAIMKYVRLKQRYGADIGVVVEDFYAKDTAELKGKIAEANAGEVDAMIVQLPLLDRETADKVCAGIAPEKDVDGLSGRGDYDSATATAINWLLSGYDIRLGDKKIALVGRGKLVGGPLLKMWQDSGLDVRVFHHGDDLGELVNYDVIVSATGVPHLIKTEMVAAGAVVVDAGTASEDGVLVGDVDEAVRERTDLAAITPKIGGVGPLTVSVLFENTLVAASKGFSATGVKI